LNIFFTQDADTESNPTYLGLRYPYFMADFSRSARGVATTQQEHAKHRGPSP